MLCGRSARSLARKRDDVLETATFFRDQVEYKPGKNRFAVPIYLRSSGYYEYTATIEVAPGGTAAPAWGGPLRMEFTFTRRGDMVETGAFRTIAAQVTGALFGTAAAGPQLAAAAE